MDVRKVFGSSAIASLGPRRRVGWQRQLLSIQSEMFGEHRDHDLVILPLRQSRNGYHADRADALDPDRKTATSQHELRRVEPMPGRKGFVLAVLLETHAV